MMLCKIYKNEFNGGISYFSLRMYQMYKKRKCLTGSSKDVMKAFKDICLGYARSKNIEIF